MGVEYVVLWTDGDKASYEYYASRKALFESHGLKVYGFGSSSVHNQDAIVLDLPGRDAKIEEYKTHLRNLGKAGIPYTTYAHMANGIWSTEREPPAAAPRRAPLTWPRPRPGTGSGAEYNMPADPRARLHRGRDLGELRVLHQAGGAGGRGSRRAHRHPPRRSAGARAGRRAALHLQQLRRLPARAGDRRQPQRGHLPVRRLLAGGRRR